MKTDWPYDKSKVYSRDSHSSLSGRRSGRGQGTYRKTRRQAEPGRADGMVWLRCACGSNLRVASDRAGKRIRCPDCSRIVPVSRDDRRTRRAKARHRGDAGEKVRTGRTRQTQERGRTAGRGSRPRAHSHAGALLSRPALTITIGVAVVLVVSIPLLILFLGGSSPPVVPETATASSEEVEPARTAETDFDVRLRKAIGEVSRNPRRYEENLALLKGLEKDAVDEESQERLWGRILPIQEEARTESERQFEAWRPRLERALEEGRLEEAGELVARFDPVYDPTGFWKSRARSEYDRLRPGAEFRRLAGKFEDTLADGRLEEATELLQRACEVAPKGSKPTLEDWGARIARARAQLASDVWFERHRRVLEGTKSAGEARLAEARRSLVSHSNERSLHEKRMEAALRDRTERSPLRLTLNQGFTLGEIRVLSYGDDRVRLAWPHGEIEYSIHSLPNETLSTLLQTGLTRGTARDFYLVGKMFLERRLYDEAAECFARASSLDPELDPILPDVERVRQATGLLHGQFEVVGNDLEVDWDFSDPAEAMDFKADVGSELSVEPGGVLEIRGSQTAIAMVREIPFQERVRVRAMPGAATDSSYLMGIRFIRPNGAEVVVLAIADPATRGFVVQKIEGGRPTNLSEPERIETWGEMEMEFRQGRLTFWMGGKTVWGGTQGGFSDLLVVVGAAAKQAGGDALARFDRVALSGSVNPAWIGKRVSDSNAVLLAELSKERLVDTEGVDSLSLDLSLDRMLADLDPGLLDAYELAVSVFQDFYAQKTLPRYQVAWSAAERLSNEHPSFAGGPYLLGYLQEGTGRASEAARSYDEALARFPEFPEALAARARLYALRGRRESARAMIESALESMPDLAGAHIVLSQIAFQEGEMEAAYESASLAEELVTAGDSIRALAKMMKNVIRGPGWTKPSVRETPHYRVKTDLRAERGRFYAERLEAIRPLYEEVLGARSSDECVAPVLIFDSREGYHSYTAFSAGGRHENTLGMFLPWCGQLILFEGIDEEETLRVLYHEGFHQFAHDVLASAPIWFNEGMAEYVGGTRIENGRIAERGLVQSGRLRNLQSALRNGWPGFSFEAIMQESQQAFYANNAPFKYAQAWSMIHFFMEGGDDHLREVLGDYIDRLKDGDTAEVAFRETWGQEDLSKIEARWLQYVNSLEP